MLRLNVCLKEVVRQAHAMSHGGMMTVAMLGGNGTKCGGCYATSALRKISTKMYSALQLDNLVLSKYW